ncbi:MAG: DUF3181 family protein [Cyanobacteria bacterium P01_E01_bin.34]
MTMTVSSRQIEELAAEIGQEVYIDVAKWHLYLADAKLHTAVAEKVAPLVDGGAVTEDAVTEALQQIPVKLAGGRTELTLFDLLPMQGILNLLDVLEKALDR